MRTTRRRLIQTSTAAVGAASLALFGQASVFADTQPLPAGGSVTVTLDRPVDLSVPYGSTVPLSGSARVDGTPAPTQDTALVYTLDVSGSTTSPVTNGLTRCGNDNGTGSGGTILDCEIRSLVNLNTEAASAPAIAEVAAVAFGGYNSYTGTAGQGRADALTGDVSPDTGLTTFTTPTLRVDPSATRPDIVTVLASANNGSPSPTGAVFGFTRFTPALAPSGNTNYEAAVLESVEAATTSTHPRKLVVLVSDGDATRGITGIPGTTLGANGGTTGGYFPNRAAFQDWVATNAAGVRFVTFAIGNTASCDGGELPTDKTLGTLQSIAEATGGSCVRVQDPADLPDVLPQVVNTTLSGIDATVDGFARGVTSSAAFPVAAGTDVPFSTTVTGLRPGQHELCARSYGRDAQGSGQARECRTVDVLGVTVAPTFGGGTDDIEGYPVAISAVTNGGAAFTGWTAAPGAGTDPGATCDFADAGQPSTTVTCTDDGTYTLTASTLPADSRTSTLTLANSAPLLQVPAFTTTGPVFVGSTVQVIAPFTDRGANDSHTCTATIGGQPASTTVVEPTTSGPGRCIASAAVSTAGTLGASVRVTDDDGGTDQESTATDAGLVVVQLTIDGGDQPGGGFTGVEGTPVRPSVSLPDGATQTWSYAYGTTPDTGTTCTLTGETTRSPSLLCTDDADVLLTLTAVLSGERQTASVPVSLKNAVPVLTVPAFDTSGPVFPGTAVTVSAPFTDAGSNDTHTCQAVWNDSVVTPGVVTAGRCRSTRTLDASLVPYTASLTVTDDDGGSDTRSTSEAPGGSLTVTAVTIDAPAGGGTAYSTSEGTPVTVTATVPAGVSLSWSATPVSGTDPGADCTVAGGSTATPSFTCDDDGTFEVQVTATAGSSSQTARRPLVVSNAAPVVTAAALSPALVPVGGLVTVTASYSDAGTNDTHTCTVDWGDGSALQPGTATAGQCKASRAATVVGARQVTVTVTDDDGAVGSRETDYLVVYDPNGGFVTGGGYVMAPSGSLSTDPTAAGKATFGFVSKYQKNATTPSGNTEFQLHASSFEFTSTGYQWLTVSGSKAQYRGTGTVNGVAGYSFLVTTVDGANRPDTFRIKVWDASGSTLFDNVRGAADDLGTAAGQPLAGGSVVVHAK